MINNSILGKWHFWWGIYSLYLTFVVDVVGCTTKETCQTATKSRGTAKKRVD